jgi:modulator of FtsH protease HflK
MIFLIFLLALIWGLLGIFIVGADERAVVSRFGRYVTVLNPGLHWIAPFIETRAIINRQRINSFYYQAQTMTQDANIVKLELTVHYRISNMRDYVFKTRDPERILQQITASAVTQLFAQTPLDLVLTTGRESLRSQLQALIQAKLIQTPTGLRLSDVALQAITPPVELKDAFNEVAKAQEDSLRLENQAQAYAAEIGPNIQSQSQRLLADANTYQQQVIAKAKGDTAQYLALLPFYQKYPAVTKARLYLDTMEAVLANCRKILVTSNNTVLYLPTEPAAVPASQPTNSLPPVPALNYPSAAATTNNNRSDLDSYATEGY